ncbi:hypothetical protein [Sulfurimonas sp.]|jgi:hypothetical protein|uniref:hypothetical protein n=1 Tax=Sulfurimonas sp. TaxID=2022749 RepID=UPI0025F83199|nr:hypothetical protein [Sulfurimonas sp.]MCK9474260.1 hypothetical protein [Sulfurimonas sp.]
MENKQVFKESLCRADQFGRPVQYWNPVKKEHYVLQVAAKGQECNILRWLKNNMVEVEFTVVTKAPNGNPIMKLKKEKVNRNMIEEAGE